MRRTPGTRNPLFGRYRLMSLLGVGGYARVYRAEEIDGDRRMVAVKIARDGSERKSRKVVRALSNEARIMTRLDHPNLVEVFEFGQVDGHYFIAMELVVGLPLKELLKRCSRRRILFGPTAAMSVAHQIAAGLQAAHTLTDREGEASPVIHRDLKPANVMVTRDGLVKLMDFGVAKWPLAEVSTTAGIIKGTPLYMAPEQVRALPVTPASDIFSLGAVLYQLLTGRPLFKADSLKTLLRQVARADIDEQLLYVPQDCHVLLPFLRRTLERSPDDRIQTAETFIRELGMAADRIDDDGDLPTLARALFGGKPPQEEVAPPLHPPTQRVPGYTEGPTAADWSVRLQREEKRKGVLVEYDRKSAAGDD